MTNFTLIVYQDSECGFTDRWGDFHEGKPSSINIFYETDPVKVGTYWAEMSDKGYLDRGEYPDVTLLMDGINIDDIDDESLNETYDLILAIMGDRVITLKEERFAEAQERIETQRLKDEAAAAARLKNEEEISRQMYEILKKKFGGT